MVGCAEEPLRRESRNQEQLDSHSRDEDRDFEESWRTCIWQPLGLLTTVKPPALRERHDCNVRGFISHSYTGCLGQYAHLAQKCFPKFIFLLINYDISLCAF